MTRESIREAFDAAYTARYTQTLPGYHVVLANAKTSVAGKPPVADMGIYHKPQATSTPAAGHHEIFIDGARRDAAVYQRHELPAGYRVSGPALLLQADATTLIEPGFQATVHESGSIFIRNES
jgi:N-methylhydantoinase A